MQRVMMKSKIHRATVTSTDRDYEGSLTIDADLLDAADILPNEQIHVWDVTNGTRLVTYALRGEPGSGEMQVNGAGAHLIHPGDIIIIATYASFDEDEIRGHEPLVVHVDAKNRERADQREHSEQCDGERSVELDADRGGRIERDQLHSQKQGDHASQSPFTGFEQFPHPRHDERHDQHFIRQHLRAPGGSDCRGRGRPCRRGLHSRPRTSAHHQTEPDQVTCECRDRRLFDQVSRGDE